jgi:DNA polymerase-1
MVIGEAPGEREDSTGRPFVGSSGKLLKRLLEDAGIDYKRAYLTNAVHCRPPMNKTPTPAQIRECKVWLDKEVQAVKPKFVLLLGNTALQAWTGKTGIRKMRGRALEQAGMVVMATYHPSFALRDPMNGFVIQRDIRKFADCIEFGGVPYERSLNVKVISGWRDFMPMLDKLSGCVAYDLETTQLYPWQTRVDLLWQEPKIVSVILGTATTQYVIPLNHSQSRFPDQERMWPMLLARLSQCSVVGQNLKFDVLWTWCQTGIRLHIANDVMLMHYLLNENDRHDLEHMAQIYFGAPEYDIPLEEKQGKGPLDRHVRYAASDGFYTRKLRFKLAKELAKVPSLEKLYKLLMLPLANLYVGIEHHGVFIDRTKLNEAEKFLVQEMKAQEAQWNKWGAGVKISSPKQIGELFYGKLGIRVIARTPTGAASTSESVLKRLQHPAAKTLLKWREANKQYVGFVKGWAPFLVGARLHPSFKLHGTVTGRPSCENPNLQQTPRDPRIRSLVTAPKGKILLEADLSQIELRIAAWMARERNMLKAFWRGDDIHWLTAMAMLRRSESTYREVVLATVDELEGFNPDFKKVTYEKALAYVQKAGPDACAERDPLWKEIRYRAKVVNFGFLYGMGWKTFKDYAFNEYEAVLTDTEAQQSRMDFFELYPDLPKWHDKMRRMARGQRYVDSPTGRRRRLPNIRSDDDWQRMAEERQAVNFPVQSFASDLNLMAALQLKEEFKDRVDIVGTVHDNILVEVEEWEHQRIARRLLEIMRAPKLLKDFQINLTVPIEAECKAGAWSDGKPVVYTVEQSGGQETPPAKPRHNPAAAGESSAGPQHRQGGARARRDDAAPVLHRADAPQSARPGKHRKRSARDRLGGEQAEFSFPDPSKRQA